MVFWTPASPKGVAICAIAVQANIAMAPNKPARKIRVVVLISASSGTASMSGKRSPRQRLTTGALDRADPVAFHQLLPQILLHVRPQPAQHFFAPRRVHRDQLA